jgi:thioredoxin-dependent peroxiredoxin
MGLIDVGRKAPAFTLPDQNGRRHALKDFHGRPVVLYFYPKDDTPGCTSQACQFRDLSPRLERHTAVVLGVSPDDVASHAAFAVKLGLRYLLLADHPGDSGVPKVCERYGVWQEKTAYGRASMGVVRTTYLIDARGRVVHRWDRVRVDGHAEEVLEAVAGL